MGRINHGPIGDQTGADPERVAAALERLELVYCELEPGSAIFFHCNLLHRSDRNTQPRPALGVDLLLQRGAQRPYKESRHPRYSPLEKWPDERIKEIGRRQVAPTAMRQPALSMSGPSLQVTAGVRNA